MFAGSLERLFGIIPKKKKKKSITRGLNMKLKEREKKVKHKSTKHEFVSRFILTI